jgi:hypothetical protein
MESLDIQAFTYEQRNQLLPELNAAFGACGGWVLDRRTLSPTNMEIQVELQVRAVLDLYAAIVGTGLELTRAGHETFTELCTRRKHRRISAELGQTIALRLEITFLDEVSLHSLLLAGPSPA